MTGKQLEARLKQVKAKIDTRQTELAGLKEQYKDLKERLAQMKLSSDGKKK